MEIDTHLKLLKKFKSAVPGMHDCGTSNLKFSVALSLCSLLYTHLWVFDTGVLWFPVHPPACIHKTSPDYSITIVRCVPYCMKVTFFFAFLFGGLDYKLLMTGEDPLSILVPTLSSTNVHVIAKLANKVPCKVTVCLKHSSLVSGICT